MRHTLGNRTDAVNNLGAIGVALFHLGEAEQAARLMAASETLRQELGISLHPATQSEVEETVMAVRRQAGEMAFVRAWQEGAAMAFAEAIAAALGQA